MNTGAAGKTKEKHLEADEKRCEPTEYDHEDGTKIEVTNKKPNEENPAPKSKQTDEQAHSQSQKAADENTHKDAWQSMSSWQGRNGSNQKWTSDRKAI